MDLKAISDDPRGVSALPLKQGDLVYLKHHGSYLCADLLTQRVHLTMPVDSTEPADFRNCLWRFMPQLAFSELKQRAKLERLASMTESELQLVQSRVDKEQAKNKDAIDKVIHEGGIMVLYGSTLCLRHEVTGLYLSADMRAAKLERDCLKLNLGEVDSSCSFRIKPCYKVRTEGGVVYYRDEVTMRSLTVKDYSVHCSDQVTNLDMDLPPYQHEANLSISPSSFQVQLYGRFTSDIPRKPNLDANTTTASASAGAGAAGGGGGGAANGWGVESEGSIGEGYKFFTKTNFLRSTMPVRLFHRETEAFLSGSASASKVPSKHVPYYKRSSFGQNFNASEAFNAKSVFCMEGLRRGQGLTVEWNTPIRIRHIPSGKYLTILQKRSTKKKPTSPQQKLASVVGAATTAASTALGSAMASVKSTKRGIFQTVTAGRKEKEKEKEKEKKFAKGSLSGALAGTTLLLPEGPDFSDELFRSQSSSVVSFVAESGEVEIQGQGQGQGTAPIQRFMADLESLYEVRLEVDDISRVANYQNFVKNSTASDKDKDNDKGRDHVEKREAKSAVADSVRALRGAVSGMSRDSAWLPIETQQELDESQTFYLQHVGMKKTQYVPNDDTSAFIEHRLPSDGGFQSLYLHSSLDLTKRADSFSSFKAFFSTERREQDAFVLVTVDPGRFFELERIRTAIPILRRYVTRLKSNYVYRSERDLADELNVLGILIYDTVKGEEDENVSPMTIKGPSERSMQATARELKVFESLMEMVQIPVCIGYRLDYDPIKAQWKDRNFAVIANVQKLTFKTIQHLFYDNRLCEEYFAGMSTYLRRYVTEDKQVLKDIIDQAEAQAEIGSANIEIVLWTDVLISQVPYPVNAAPCLTTLISNNANLLDKYVGTETIDRFKQLINDNGPTENLLRFFIAICSCQGKNIISNQELCYKELYMNESMRRELLLDVYVGGEPGELQMWNSMSDANWAKAHPGKTIDHGEFLARQEWEKGFQPVFVSWWSSDNWQIGQDELFYSPKRLMMKAVNGKVRIEELCWPLEPERLCEICTGRKWEEVHEAHLLDEQSEAKVKFDQHRQLAEYFEAQIDLYAEMCLGRSYNVIYSLEKSYPYEMVISMIANERLPDQVRASFANLLDRLWIDRFPHEMNCGRPTLPDKIWIYSELHDVNLIDKNALPQFRLPAQSPLRSITSPFYSIPDANKFHLVQDFVSDFFMELEGKQVVADREKNIFVLNVLSVLQKLFSFGFYGTRAEILDLCDPLIATLDGRADRFSLDDDDDMNDFHSADPTRDPRYKVETLSIILMNCKENIINSLDNVRKLRGHHRTGKLLYKFKGWYEAKKEWVSKGHIPKDTAKDDAAVSDLQRTKSGKDIAVDECRRGSLARNASIKSMGLHLDVDDVKKVNFADTLDEHNGDQSEKSIAALAFQSKNADMISYFKDIFESKEGRSLELDEMSMAPLHTILLDLLMYESDSLFEAVLGLLYSEHTQKQFIIDVLSDVTILPCKEVPIFGSFDELDGAVSVLRNHIESFEIWGISNEFSDDDPNTFKEVVKILQDLRTFLVCNDEIGGEGKVVVENYGDGVLPNKLHQDLLFFLDIQNVIIEIFMLRSYYADELKKQSGMKKPSSSLSITPGELGSGKGGSGSEGESASLKNFVVLGTEILTYWVKDNRRNQKIAYDNIDLLMEWIEHEVGMTKAMKAVFAFHGELCLYTDEGLFEHFAELLAREKIVAFLDFYAQQIEPENDILTRNQNLTVKHLLDPRFKSLLDLESPLERFEKSSFSSTEQYYENEQDSYAYHLQLVALLTMCCKERNMSNTAKLQRILSSDRLMEQIADHACPDEVLHVYIDALNTIYFDTPLIEEELQHSPLFWNVCLTRFIEKLRDEPHIKTYNAARRSLYVSRRVSQSVRGSASSMNGLVDEVADDFNVNGLLLRAVHAYFSEVFHQRRRTKEMEEQMSLLVEALLDVAKEAKNDAMTRKLAVGTIDAMIMDKDPVSEDLRRQLEKLDERLRKAKKESDDRPGANNEVDEEEALQDVSAAFSIFKRVLVEDPAVQAELDDDKSELVATFERVEELTDPNEPNYKRLKEEAQRKSEGGNISYGNLFRSGKMNEKQLKEMVALADCRKSKLTFNHLVRRMKRYIQANLSKVSGPVATSGLGDSDNGGLAGAEAREELKRISVVTENIQRIMEIWSIHLHEARQSRYLDGVEENNDSDDDEEVETSSSGAKRSTGATKEEDKFGSSTSEEALNPGKKSLRWRQNNLNSLGVMEIVYDIMCKLKSGPLVEAALDLGKAMLMDGNVMCQNAFYEYAWKADLDGKWFKNVYDRIYGLKHSILRFRELDEAASVKADGLNEQKMVVKTKVLNIMKFLHLLCEGHNEKVQNMLRTQPDNRQSYNILHGLAVFLSEITEAPDVLRHMRSAEIQQLISVLEVLVEAMQGPCAPNQELIASSEAIRVCNLILDSSFKYNRRRKFTMLVKSLAMKLLVACLENREDRSLAHALAVYVEPRVLNQLLVETVEIAKEARKALLAASSAVDGEVPGGTNKSDQKLIRESDQFFSKYNLPRHELINTIHTLDATLVDIMTIRTLMANLTPELHDAITPKKPRSRQEKGTKLWLAERTTLKQLGRVEVNWNNHIELMYFILPQESSSLTNTSKQRFLDTADLSTQEIRAKQFLDKSDDFIDEMRVLDSLGRSKYYCFVRDNYFEINMLTYIFVVLINFAILVGVKDSATSELDAAENIQTDVIVGILAFLCMFGYTTILAYWLMSLIPMVKRKLNRYVMNSKDDIFIKLRHPEAFYPLLGSLPIYILVCVIDFLVREEFRHGYYQALLVIYGIWLLRASRNYIVIPDNTIVFFYVWFYDVVTQFEVLIHLTWLIFIAPMGFLRAYFFSFVLLDAVNISGYMQDTVKAVYKPWKPLLNTFALFIIVITIFAVSGYFIFKEDSFLECEGDDCPDGQDEVTCSNLAECFWWVLYSTIRTQDLAESMELVTHENNSLYYKRIFFDLLFFIVLGVLLFDMVTGIIVDTFSALREETAARNEILTNECFISGLRREQFEDLGLDFNSLKNNDQFLWNYVFFIRYLQLKDASEYNGGEAYVKKLVEQNDPSWLPARKAWILENMIGKSGTIGRLADQGGGGTAASGRSGGVATGSLDAALLKRLIDVNQQTLAKMEKMFDMMQVQHQLQQRNEGSTEEDSHR